MFAVECSPARSGEEGLVFSFKKAQCDTIQSHWKRGRPARPSVVSCQLIVQVFVLLVHNMRLGYHQLGGGRE